MALPAAGVRALIREELPSQGWQGFLIMDFEATCWETGNWNQEIIEFPAVLLDGKTLEVLGEFRDFVRPVEAPRLTRFCTNLTSITQAQVDGGHLLSTVLQNFSTWLATHGLQADKVLPVTCGDWDLRDMLPQECGRKGLNSLVPRELLKWCNIKALFEHATNQDRCGMKPMLRALGLRVIGHHHSGIDDCRNIARLFQELLCRYGRAARPTTRWYPPAPYPEQSPAPTPAPEVPTLSQHEKNFLKHAKAVREILKLEAQQASGQSLAPNQVLKMNRKSDVLRELGEALESVAVDSDLRQRNAEVIQAWADVQAPANEGDVEASAEDVSSHEAIEPEVVEKSQEFGRRPRPPGGRSGRARQRDAERRASRQ